MQPQAGKKKKPQPQQASHENAAAARVPITVKGQRYVAPEGRHSQQTHRRAEERAAAGGHGSEKEQHAHDRTAMSAGIAESAAEKIRHQERSKPK
jgi:hypothetical protein